MKYCRHVLVILTVALLGGCRSYGPWRPAKEDAPWIDAGQQATTIRRSVDPPPFIVASLGYQTAWLDAHDRQIRPGKVREQVETYLAGHSSTLPWQPTGTFVKGTEQLLTPYRLILVSLNPAVLLMTPHNYGSPAGRTLHELVVPISPWQYLSWDTTPAFPANGLIYGTRVPCVAGTLWFSPDLDQPPIPLVVQGNTAEIPLASGRLQLAREGAEWKVTRVP